MVEEDTLEFICKQCGHCCMDLSGAINVCATKKDVQDGKGNVKMSRLTLDTHFSVRLFSFVTMLRQVEWYYFKT